MSKWDLTPFYASIDAWQKDFESLPNEIEKLALYKGQLKDKAQFKAYHKADEALTLKLYRLYGYIHLASDLNLKDQEKQAKNQELMMMFSKLNQATSFVSPELIEIGQDAVMEMLKGDAFLENYRFPMQTLFDQQKHVLSTDQERLMSNFGAIRSIPSTLHQALAIIDRDDEEIELSTKEKVKVGSSNWTSLIGDVPTAEDRKKVFEATFKRYQNNKAAFAATYQLVLMNLKANYESRGYTTSLEAALSRNNIPTSVFHNLVNVASENTEPLKRYINIRKKFLNLDEYHTYDRFLHLKQDTKKYPYEDALELFYRSLEGYDEEFVAKQKDAVKQGYVDAYPQEGKRTGAYSSGLYGFHPYILLNHDDTLSSVMTLVHEAGHSAHTLFSSEAQPLPIADYTIFVAEIASTFNEQILQDYLIKNASSKDEKIVLLEAAIDRIMSTFYRQTLFANFELIANEKVAKNEPITADSLSQIMIELYDHYYGLDLKKEVYSPYEWAYIPHFFHTPYYVYQYATSYSASFKIYQDVKQGVPQAMEKYKTMLKSGGSQYPVDQAKAAGADLTDKTPFLAVVTRLNELLDELENTLK